MPDQIVRAGQPYDYKIVTGTYGSRRETCYKIDREDMEIPRGKYRGSLPFNILINGVRWECIAVATIGGRTYDKIKNTETGEIKKYEREVLLDFLAKNWKQWQKKVSQKVVISDNSCTFEQSTDEVKHTQNEIVFPEVDF